MGIDLANVQLGIEDEFGILLPQGPIREKREGSGYDVRMDDLADWVAQAVAEQNPTENHRVFERVRKVFADQLGIEEELIRKDAWLIRDLRLG